MCVSCVCGPWRSARPRDVSGCGSSLQLHAVRSAYLTSQSFSRPSLVSLSPLCLSPPTPVPRPARECASPVCACVSLPASGVRAGPAGPIAADGDAPPCTSTSHNRQSKLYIGVNLITFNTICYRVCPCLRLELDRAESLDLYNLNIVSPRYITWCQTPRAEPAAARGLHSSASASRCTAPASGSHAEACSAPPEDITLRPLRL